MLLVEQVFECCFLYLQPEFSFVFHFFLLNAIVSQPPQGMLLDG